jgi:hypothetical protein
MDKKKALKILGIVVENVLYFAGIAFGFWVLSMGFRVLWEMAKHIF